MFVEIAVVSGCTGTNAFGEAATSPAAVTVIGDCAAPAGTVTVNDDALPDVTVPRTPPNWTMCAAYVDAKEPERVMDPPASAEAGVKDVIDGRNPFPDSVTVSGELGAFERKTNEPVRAPVIVGAKVTVKWAESYGAMLALAGETEKTAESMEADVIESVIDPEFVTVTMLESWRSTPTSPKAIAEADGVNTTRPPKANSPKLLTVAVTLPDRSGLETDDCVDATTAVQFGSDP